jgi:HD-GYP domain-containing protein (c-di-GMP phosphodiesterase class II)
MSSDRKIDTRDLRVGMQVVELDRPWLETPFLLQGFEIRSQEDIRQLQKYCSYVYVGTAPQRQAYDSGPRRLRAKRKSREEMFKGRSLGNYLDKSDWDEEFPQAKEAVSDLARGVDELFDDIRRDGSLKMLKIKVAVQPMIDSITRNPDACIWLARMKQLDTYHYQHALGTSIWAVALGRQLGLPSQDLRSLAVGGVLMDIGKLRIDRELLDARRKLTDEEFQRVKDHVAFGMESFGERGLMNQDIADMVAHHHERFDGTGYPQGLKGERIPVFGRIASIVDTYDAITSHRSYARAMAPADAVKLLYERRDTAFQAELVEEFIQAIGIYPAGTLVELSSGEVAIVVAEYRTRRLRPRVLVLLDSHKQPLLREKTIDLLTQTHAPDGSELSIVGSLEPDAYGLDMNNIRLRSP